MFAPFFPVHCNTPVPFFGGEGGTCSSKRIIAQETSVCKTGIAGMTFVFKVTQSS